MMKTRALTPAQVRSKATKMAKDKARDYWCKRLELFFTEPVGFEEEVGDVPFLEEG